MHYILSLFCAICWVATCFAQTALDSIPFTVGADHRVYICCRVNNSDTLRFLFDTGATDMVLNVQSPRTKDIMKFDGTVNNLGTTGTGSVARSSFNRLEIGKQELDSLAFLGIDYPPELWDGVIGLSFIRRYTIVLDYNRENIYLYSPGTYFPPAEASTLPVNWTHGVPVITLGLAIHGKSYVVRTEIDTGSDRVLDLSTPFVRNHQLLGTQQPFAVSHISSSDGGSGELLNVWFDRLAIGNKHYNRIPGAFSTLTSGLLAGEAVDAMAGNNLLQRFNLALDFSHNRISLWPNKRMELKYYDFLP